MNSQNIKINQLSDEEFSKAFNFIDKILSQYDTENNDDYIELVSHLITVMQTLKSGGEFAFSEMINKPEIYAKKL